MKTNGIITVKNKLNICNLPLIIDKEKKEYGEK